MTKTFRLSINKIYLFLAAEYSNGTAFSASIFYYHNTYS